MAYSGGNWKRIACTLALVAGVAVSASAAPTGGRKSKHTKAKTLQATETQATGTKSSSHTWGQAFAPATVNPQGSLLGTPGLWSSQFAETLAPGQVTSGVYAQRFTRNPGAEVFTDVQAGWTMGITRWLELSFATTPYRRVRVASPEMLTFPSTGTFRNFNPVAPFARNPLVHGPVDMTVAATVGLLSQDRNAPFGLAVQAYEHIPYFQDFRHVVNLYGVSTGKPIFGVNVLMDKYLGDAGEWVGNVGYQHSNLLNEGGRVNIPLRDNFVWSTGLVFPRTTRLQGIVEYNGNVPFGNGAHYQTFGPLDPVDATYGVRFSPLPWVGLNAGYRLAVNSGFGNPSGFVFGVSFGTAEQKVAPPPPTLTCNADQSSVIQGGTVHITTTVSPEGLPYTYTWTSNEAAKLTPNQSQASFDTTGLTPGLYSVAARVDNGQGGVADCSTNIEVQEKPKHPPTVSCSAEPTTVRPGAAVTLTAQATSPDDRPLTYAWTVTSGKLDTDNQATVHVDTTGVAPGTLNANVAVHDDRGLSANCSSAVTVEAPPPPPQASLATTLNFKHNSARIDNVAKAALDDVALRLQQDPNAHAVIVGFSGPEEGPRTRNQARKEAAITRLAEERAVNAKAYLVQEKGVSADRIQVRENHANGGQKAEVWVVPQGASFTGSAAQFEENAVRPAKPVHHRRPRRRATPKG